MALKMVILGFDGENTAAGVWESIEDQQKLGVVEIEDAVIAYRAAEGGAAKVHQTHSTTARGVKRGAGVGLLAGLLLGGPIGGVIAGATVGAIAGSLRNHGIDDVLVENTVRGLGPDKSTLFLLGEAVDEEKLRASLKPYKARVLQTTLSEEQEEKLRKALAKEEFGTSG